jgi:16S rRNA (uracil1498-N3)-methyltransferase
MMSTFVETAGLHPTMNRSKNMAGQGEIVPTLFALPWFYHPHELVEGARVQLDPEEARHASGARRLQSGEVVCLFDGLGRVARATIAGIGARGREVEVELGDVERVVPPQPVVHLASALPKGDRQSVMLDMATQLGMASFAPLQCERSIVKASAHASERWRRICVEACKQSRRAYLPKILPAVSLATAIHDADHTVWLARPGGEEPARELDQAESMEQITILVGPEGGFTEAEAEKAQAAGAVAVSLGDGILRIETAAVALLSFLSIARQP